LAVQLSLAAKSCMLADCINPVSTDVLAVTVINRSHAARTLIG
jgi:hypothetical protein